MNQTRRILTLNVLHNDWYQEERARQVAQEIEALEPDHVILQEVSVNGKIEENPVIKSIMEHTNLSVDHAVPYGNNQYNDHLITLGRKLLIVNRGKLCTSNESHRASFVVYATAPNQHFTIFNYHGYWGGQNQHIREKDIVEINSTANKLELLHPNNTIVLGGDFNSDANSSVARYLEGLQSLKDTGTYWVDTWKYSGVPQSSGYTLDSRNLLGHMTAKTVGITSPECNPNRRIDFLYVKGWVYGKSGMPIKTKLCFTDTHGGETTASDHYGIYSEIQL